ncbi:protein FAM83H isoform X2 [Pseudoliparis swirei]|uniref:protein FAM83H isoform X2 n=1 Tax=Pseudoliparis swirei TaxID=2059687 RepID=UPI0024BE727A|nr:protein FAM83H isoform X2 [Pseudoliparis swirei]
MHANFLVFALLFQVIAVVMDTFTDVDIFSDLLDAAARHIAVYILLDEQEAHNFVSMVENCKVNLDMHPMVRVRTVAGVTYYSRTGKSFKGQVKDRFLLADCKAVLSGNYSFMWSFEKIHRCIAHLFLGELVATFDEEFRILFAQSEPLVIDPSKAALALSDSSSTSSYLGNQFSLKRTQSLLNPMSFRRQPEVSPAFPYGDSDRNLALPFRRNDPFRQTVEPVTSTLIGKYSQQQFRPQQSYLDQGRSIVSRQMDLNSSASKRHSYAEGTQENYSSSRQYMKNRVMNDLDETDVQREQTQSTYYLNEGPGPGSSHGHYDRLRGRPSQLYIDQHSDSNYRSDPEPPPGKFTRSYFSTEDLRGPQVPPLAGRYGGDFTNKRPTIGQPYACQTSPTQLHPPEKKQNKHTKKPSDQEPDEEEAAREGLRSWRIQSYLNTYDESGEEGLAQPLGPDAFEDLPPSQQPSATEQSAARFGTNEPPNVTPKPRPDIMRPRYGKPILNEGNSNDSDPKTTAKDPLPVSDVKPFALEQKAREAEMERERISERVAAREVDVDTEMKENTDIFLSKHESFHSRINPLLQRTSRLRSSLIFSSSKGEMHSGSLGLKPSTDQDEELDTVRTSSIVAQILEKRRSLSREPFEWRKKAEEKAKEKEWEKEMEKEREKQRERERELQQKEREVRMKEEMKEREREQQQKDNEIRMKEEMKEREREQQQKEREIRMKEEMKEREREQQQKEREIRMKEEMKEREREQQQKENEIRMKEEMKEKERERQQKEREIRMKDEMNAKEEPPKTDEEVKKRPTAEQSEDVNMNDPSNRLQYFKDLEAKRNGSTMETESSLKAPEPAEKKPDRFDYHPQSSTITPKIPSVSVSSAEPEPKKTDISSKLAELTRRSSFSSSKPPVNFAKPPLRHVEASPPRKEESTSESQIKDLFKSLKPLASPKIFRRDPVKFKGLNPRRVSSGEDTLTTDATDAEKSEHKKSRSYSSSTLTHEFRDGLHKGLGSTSSINTLGESRGEGKTLDFLKKQTQRLKGFLGPKDKEKKSCGDDRGMSTVREFTEDSSRKHSFSFRDKGSTTPDQATGYPKTSTSMSGPSRYQNPGSSALYSSNLRDDTKVILEQISANSQKNRLEREETGGDRDGGAKGLERQNSIKSRFLHPQTYVQEREGLLKRIESLRKEKKVYSRFEMGNNLG